MTEAHVPALPDSPLDPLRALATLCRVDRAEHAGDAGPILASMHRAESEHIRELRKYEVVFGRDSLISALLVFTEFPRLLLTTVLTLARYQGKRWEPLSEEEPGRIPHEVRDPSDPIAREITESSGWHWPYYGAIDSTPYFLLGLARLHRAGYWAHGLEKATIDAVDWLVRRLHNGNGLLVSNPTNPRGIENQVWKDSWDAFSRPDGSVVRPPLAPLVAQALAYDACLEGAELLQALGASDGRPSELRALASTLRRELFDTYWVTDTRGSYFASAVELPSIDQRRSLAVRASDMGQLFASKVLSGERYREMRHALIQAIFEPDLLCGAGIRTLAIGERRYRPTAYHNGSSWPWDTAVTAIGLEQNGYRLLAAELFERVLRVHRATGLFPEFVRGDSGDTVRINRSTVDVLDPDGRRNRVAQPPQEIQALTVCSVLAVQGRVRRDALTQLDLSRDDLAFEEDILRGARGAI